MEILEDRILNESKNIQDSIIVDFAYLREQPEITNDYIRELNDSIALLVSIGVIFIATIIFFFLFS